MAENPSNYGYKRIHLPLNLLTAFHQSNLNVEANVISFKKINNHSLHVIFSDVRNISANNTFLSVYCPISFYNGSLSTLECSRTLKTFWFTNTRRQDYVHRSLYF
jgi:hypothetical protein